MARHTRKDGSSSPFAWTTVLYLLLVFIAPLALLGTAHAEEGEAAEQDNYGTGKMESHVVAWIGESFTDMTPCSSDWYRFGNYILMCWCDAEWQG